VEVDGRPVLIRATALTDRGPVRLYSVHVVAPVGAGREPWAKELRQVTAAVKSERQAVVVAGDFNATPASAGLGRLSRASCVPGSIDSAGALWTDLGSPESGPHAHDFVSATLEVSHRTVTVATRP